MVSNFLRTSLCSKGDSETYKTVHEGHKHCKCEFCDKDFGRKKNLQKHIKTVHINQIYTFFTGQIVNDDFGPTAESSEVKLFSIEEIPWDELAFPTVVKTLRLYLQNGKGEVFNETLSY